MPNKGHVRAFVITVQDGSPRNVMFRAGQHSHNMKQWRSPMHSRSAQVDDYDRLRFRS